MILVENISKYYGRKAAVSRLSLSVEKGQVLGFIGSNGAGKTTTMKMLCGVMPISEGSAKICGIDVSSNPLKAKSHIGYLPENAPLHPSMTVKAFLHYCAEMHGIQRKEQERKIKRVLDSCALYPVLNEEVEALSKGYKRRVCLAQAIMHEPDVLIMDEPTDGLDPNQKREIRNLILEMRENCAIIISTHILEEVEAVCSHVAVLSMGKKVFDGTTGEFRALSPEDGSVDVTLRLSAIEKATEAFADLKGAGKILVPPIAATAHEGLSLRILKGEKSGGELLAEAYKSASKKGIDVISCHINNGQLDGVFARLSPDRSENGDTEE